MLTHKDMTVVCEMLDNAIEQLEEEAMPNAKVARETLAAIDELKGIQARAKHVMEEMEVAAYKDPSKF